MRRFIAVAAVFIASMQVVAVDASAKVVESSDTPDFNAVIWFEMPALWDYTTSSEYYVEKGAIYCEYCGKFEIKYSADNIPLSIKLKKTHNERVLETFYSYQSLDGSDILLQKQSWDGLAALPIKRSIRDEIGKKHNLYLDAAYVYIFETKSPLPKRRNPVNS